MEPFRPAVDVGLRTTHKSSFGRKIWFSKLKPNEIVIVLTEVGRVGISTLPDSKSVDIFGLLFAESHG